VSGAGAAEATIPGVWAAGSWRDTASGGRLTLMDPSTAETWGHVSAAGPREVDEAAVFAQSAHRAGTWRSLPPLQRVRTLAAAARRLREDAAPLARTLARESGMPDGFARLVEVPLAADALDYFGALCARDGGRLLDFNPGMAPGEYLAFTRREPAGPAALITPWNFPLLIPAWKVGAALAAGCPVLLKPSPRAPLSAISLARCLEESGAPPGTVQVLCGGDETGRALVDHPAVRVVSFTGSTAAGRAVGSAAGAGLKRLSLQLSGKSPQIVFADADLDQAAAGCLFGAFWHAGQVCQAGSRVLVQEAVCDRFLTQLADAARELRVGPALDPDTDVGPLAEGPRRLEALRAAVADAVAAGARVVCGGRGWRDGGCYFEPTVIAGAPPAARVAREELFGPVVCLLPFRDEDEAVALANASEYGLAAGVWTADLKRGLRLAHRIEAGILWLNTYLTLTPLATVGGRKSSGVGAELGLDALQTYLESRTVIAGMDAEGTRFY
jgi:phenylacetaldehyde dehydrogenase